MAAQAPFDPTTLGTDLNIAMNDVPGVWGLATGLANLANAHIRRLCCPAGGLFYDDNYGPDVTVLDMINSSPTAADLAHAQASWSSEIEKDERVASCAVTINLDAQTEQMFITVVETLATGQTFAFVIAASGLTVALIQLDGVSVAAAVTGTPAAPGIQLVVGPPGSDGGIGPAGTAGASGTPHLTLDFDEDIGSTQSGNQDVLYQRLVNFDALPGSITFDFNGYISSTAGTATFQIQYGGTRGNADGVNVGAPLTTTNSAPTIAERTVTIANPGGKLLVKITGQSSGVGQTAAISEDRTLTIR